MICVHQAINGKKIIHKVTINNMNHETLLAKEFNIRQDHAENIVKLIDEGNTIPFIARYRKEQTGSCDDQVLREIDERLNYLRNLDKRKSEVIESITSQGKMTDEIMASLDKALTLAVVEDIYRPYKQKRKTRASIAIEKGLEPLADYIMSEPTSGDLQAEASKYIDAEKEVDSIEKAISYAQDIIAERVSDNAKVRQLVRDQINLTAKIETCFNDKEYKRLETATQTKKDDINKFFTYEMYKEYSEAVSTIPSHRILAINRGEKENCLKVTINHDIEQVTEKIKNMYITKESIGKNIISLAIDDSYSRLIFPSIEREVRNDLSEKANEQAISMFEVNLKPLLMQPPLKKCRIMGLDPAYRTGCKVAIIDANSNVMATGVVYPTPPQSKIEESIKTLKHAIEKCKVDVIAIGNGTASKEAEIFVAELITKVDRPVSYAVVNEAGASVYSASKLGAEEFPEYDVSLRSAVSIARRLQDPLAELIKIDVKSIGVGQYQHDMPQARLTTALEGVVEDCVNSVGVDLNSASVSLLTYVAGLNQSVAKNIIEYRKEKPFDSREELKKVPKLGAKAYEQCAGFLRISGAKNILDNTAVHPESYKAVQDLMQIMGYSLEDIKAGRLQNIKQEIEQKGMSKIANLLGIGEPTLKDIIEELLRPGRDIRDSLPKPILRSDLLDISNLKAGMEIIGTVRNVIDFGVFVDIGVHQDGLVHISQITDKFIKHPSEVLKVGDVVTVKVLDVDVQKKKISLTMKLDANKDYMSKIDNTKRDNKSNNNQKYNSKAEGKKSSGQNLEEMLKSLQNKFGN